MAHVLIGAGIAPLRERADEHSVIVDEGLYGMEADVLEEKDAFLHVRMEYGYEGWVLQKQTVMGSWPENLPKWRVVRPQTDVMEQTEVASVIKVSLPRASVVCEAPEMYNRHLKEGWLAVRLCDGSLGYIRISCLAPYIRPSRNPLDTPAVNESAFRQAVAETAKSYLGTCYRWGGKSPQGIDCSGLVSIAYLMQGVIIYRDASIHPDFPIHRIRQEDMNTGDLLFFKGHVAMYLGGERKLYLHSTGKAGSDGVVYNSLKEGDPLYRRDLAEGILYVGSLYPLK